MNVGIYDAYLCWRISDIFQGSCDFEYGSFCTWDNVLNGNTTGRDDFDWDTVSGSTISYGTGPKVDHTLGTALGKVYLY